MAKKVHPSGPSRCRREVQELGQVGPGRRDRHAQLHHAPRTSSPPRGSCKKGKVISLALNFDHTVRRAPRANIPALGRINPIHTMLRTGTDAYSGVLDNRGIRAADDIVIMPLQCGTQWDGLGHILYENYMWNGYDCRKVTSAGAQKCGIEKTKNKMVGRGVLLDVRALKGVELLADGFAITSEDLDDTAKKQGVEVRRGDYVLVRTGHDGALPEAGSWDGYPGGDAPGFAFETLDGSSARRSRRSRPTRGAARCGRTRPRTASTSPGTGSPSRSWA